MCFCLSIVGCRNAWRRNKEIKRRGQPVSFAYFYFKQSMMSSGTLPRICRFVQEGQSSVPIRCSRGWLVVKQVKLCVTPIICTLLRFLFTAQEQTWKRSLLRQRQNTKKRKRRRKSIILQLPRYVNERNSYTVFWQIRINSRTSAHFIVLSTCYTSFCFGF